MFPLGAKINLIDNKVVYTIALKQKNTDILEKTLLDISDYKSENYGKYLSKSKILDIIKPSNKNTNKVTEWLKKHNTYYVNKGDAIVCMSNIKDVESMFDINIVKNGSTYKILNYRDYTIPNKLRNIIEFIEGLSNNNYDHSIKKHSVHKSSYNDIIAQNTDSIIPDTGAVGREVINKLYNKVYFMSNLYVHLLYIKKCNRAHKINFIDIKISIPIYMKVKSRIGLQLFFYYVF